MGAGYHGGFGKTKGAQNRSIGTSQTQSSSIQESYGFMPNHSNIETPIGKFVDYSLNYDNPNAQGKAEAYKKALGYTKDNAVELQEKIHNSVSSGAINPYSISETEYGTKFKFRISITGPNGKTKNVIAVYQIDKGSTVPRLITNYVEAKKWLKKM